MAKTPKARKAAKPAATRGRPSGGEKVQIAARIPEAVLRGLDARAAQRGLSRNDALIQAALDYGDFPNGRPVVKEEKRSVASTVKTATPDPIAPGARLDKKSIGRRTGPAIPKTPPKAAPVGEAI